MNTVRIGPKEKRFLDELEALFVGAKVDGDSGFVNLMRMKHGYFKSIRPKLMEAIDQRAERDSSFREELFDKLYTFFNRYFCESGSIYFRHLPAFSRTYERVYADGQDVALSWKTQMLYYVKSDVLARSMPVELSEEGKPQNTRRFYFDASEVEHKKNNERREFVFAFGEVKRATEGKVVHLNVAYSQGGKKTKTDDIIRKARKGGVSLSEDELQKAIGVFRRQTEADFFINKDARGFLREQFDLWMYQYIFEEETVFEEKRLNQLQTIKDIAYNIIDFIAQFEDELRRVWEKPKFVRSVNYVVTLDQLTDEVLDKVVKHKGAKAQTAEWIKLGMVADTFSVKAIFSGQKSIDNKNGATDAYKFLPLDTKYFKDLELEILDGLGNLDETLDGELVHSENWQALNSLQRRYKGRVRCIYIDPPYNTAATEIDYKNNYRHSSWLSLMQDRLLMSKRLLDVEKGFLCCTIDDAEQKILSQLIEYIYGEVAGTVSIRIKPSGRPIPNGFALSHEYALFARTNINNPVKRLPHSKEQIARYGKSDNKGDFFWEMFRKAGSNSNRKDRPTMFYPFFVNKKNNTVRLANMEYHENSQTYKLLENPTDDEVQVFPIKDDETEGCWYFGYDRAKKMTGEFKPVQQDEKSYKIYYRRRLNEGVQPTTHWSDSKYSATEHGTALLKSLFGKQEIFSYPKSIHAVKDCLNVSGASENSDDTFLDYFAGSGTTAHAVINLNREDGGNRKYLLVEMGDYFHTVLLPRIKKVVYSKDWKEGKPFSHEGVSHFLKYYTLEQYEEALRNSRYDDGEQLELDSTKSPFEQYVFFGDDKLAHAVKPLKNGKLKINLHDLYPDIDIAESLANILGKSIRQRTADTVTFADGTTEKTNLATMTEKEKRQFISLIKPYLWWGE